MPNDYRGPEFLAGDANEPLKRVRCPVHGFIRFSEYERRIIDHPLFRRLRYIRQLALTELVYPGASHTRFEHSLGVMEVATRAFDSLASKHGGLMDEVFKQVPGYAYDTLAKARQDLRLAALLHDVGHGPFSHAAEEVLHEGGHEQLSLRVIREADLLGSEIDRYYGERTAGRVAAIVEGGEAIAPQLALLHDIVSGEMDADRTDYLLRDSLHCGVDYGRFDYRRMIECLELRQVEGGGLQVALHKGGIHTFEALILARYQMNAQVYYHRLRRIYDHYLVAYFKALGDAAPRGDAAILAATDVGMLEQIRQDAVAGDGDRRALARRIWDRNHHRVVYETPLSDDANAAARAGTVAKALQEHFTQHEIILDQAKGKIHKLARLDGPDREPGVELWVLDGDEQWLLADRSQVLRTLPRQFQCSRVFAAVDPEDMVTRRSMARMARETEPPAEGIDGAATNGGS
ncbi:MAG: HD domain-containing protein [Fimbriimonadaceae bacterium]|nr:HD domain-containing protein [Fimbriimonadaceae bacterium]